MTVETVRKLVRPVVTLLFSLAIVVFTALGLVNPDRFVEMVTIIVAFWFGSRTPQPPTPTP